MKTTLVIDDKIMKRIKIEAVKRRTTLSQLVNLAIQKLLETSDRPRGVLKTLPEFSGGVPRADVANREALYSLMESK